MSLGDSKAGVGQVNSDGSNDERKDCFGRALLVFEPPLYLARTRLWSQGGAAVSITACCSSGGHLKHKHISHV